MSDLVGYPEDRFSHEVATHLFVLLWAYMATNKSAFIFFVAAIKDTDICRSRYFMLILSMTLLACVVYF